MLSNYRFLPVSAPVIVSQGPKKDLQVKSILLGDQTQVDSKPASQPENASLNQCQLIAANRPKLVLRAPPAGGGDKVSQ